MKSQSFVLLILILVLPGLGAFSAGPSLQPLHVEEDRIVDSSGRQVILRGVNAGMRSKMPPFYPFDPEPDFKTALSRYTEVIDSLGANVVRLLMIYEAAEPVRGQYNNEYLSIYDSMVEAFAERGIRVIVDSHQDVFSRRFCGDGFPDWAIPERFRDMDHRSDCRLWEARYFSNPVARSFDRFWSNEDGVQDNYVELFRMLAERYKDQPAVIGFEPMNEPFPGWWGLSHYTSWHEEQLYPMYEKVAKAVHSADPRYLVFIDICPLENTGMWKTEREKPDISNLVLAPHYYDLGYLGLASSPGGDIETMRKGLSKHMRWARDWVIPVLVSEYGVSMQRNDAGSYIQKLYSVFDRMHLSGTIWEASMSDTLWNFRQKNIIEPDGEVKPAAYNIDRPCPRAVSGVIEKFSFDAQTKTFELSWTEAPDADSPTRIYLPPRIYEREPEVDFQGESSFCDREEMILCIPPAGEGGKRTIKISP